MSRVVVSIDDACPSSKRGTLSKPALALHPKTYHISTMADEPVTLEFMARQQQRLLDEMGSMCDQMASFRDDMQVLTAMVIRLDGTVGLVLTELRAMHSQHQRLANSRAPP
jgi:hypothetical protein